MLAVGMASFAAASSELTLVNHTGGSGGPGSFDGTGTAARLRQPGGVAWDGLGHAYIADTGNHVIRKLDLVTGAVTTLAGLAESPGRWDGPGARARLNGPEGLAFDGNRTLYVADTGNARLRAVDVRTGAVRTLLPWAFAEGGTNAGQPVPAYFHRPAGIVFSAPGRLLVADNYAHVIWAVDLATMQQSVAAGNRYSSGLADGSLSTALFLGPSGLAKAEDGSVYVSETGNSRIRKVDFVAQTVTTVAGSGAFGYVDGYGPQAKFRYPAGIASAPGIGLYIADTGNHVLRLFVPGTGLVTTIAGLGGTPGSADGQPTARFSSPRGVAWTAGRLLVADSGNDAVRGFAPTTWTVSTLCGRARREAAYADGDAASARFGSIDAIASDRRGTLYVPDNMNRVLRAVDAATGATTTVAGLAGAPPAVVDGIGGAARFGYLGAVAFDGDRTLYLLDEFTIRSVDVLTRAVTTLAGSPGQSGVVDGVGPAARLYSLTSLAAEPGTVYLPERLACVLRRLDVATRTVSTLAGRRGERGECNFVDGPLASAEFDGLGPVAVVGPRRLAIGDGGRLREVDLAAEMVRTVAGNEPYGPVDGFGTAAGFGYFHALDVDGAGHLLVCDDSALRDVDLATAEVRTVGGTLGSKGTEEGTGAFARLDRPGGVACLGPDRRFVVEADGRTLRAGTRALADRAVVDRPAVRVGETCRLSASPATGNAFSWRMVRRPATSSAGFSSSTAAETLFVPDVPDRWEFELSATDAGGNRSLSRVVLEAEPSDCSGLDVSISTPPLCEGQDPFTASVPDAGPGATYQWTIGGESASLQDGTNQSPPFYAEWTETLVRVRVTTPAGCVKNGQVSVPFHSNPRATMTADTERICRGTGAQLAVSIWPERPVSLVWKDGYVQSGLESSPVLRPVSPETSTAYSVASVSDGSCAWGPFSAVPKWVIVQPGGPPPVGLVAPSSVPARRRGLVASVPDLPGRTWAWTIRGGTLVSGQGSPQITFDAGFPGTLVVSVAEVLAGGCLTSDATANVDVVDSAGTGTSFYPLAGSS